MPASICLRSAVAGLVLAFAATSSGWPITSRELVDVQFAANDSLIILVSAPGARAPGIYLQRPDAAAPVLLCPLVSPAAFSFDRKTIIERSTGAQAELRLYDPMSCRLLARVPVDGTVIDADVRGKYIAVALQFASGIEPQYELRTYTLKGRMLARAALGRNIEIGFAPDGRSVLNFDLSDGAVLAWRMPTLARVTVPAWLASGEATFVPGSALVKHYVDGALSVVRWPSGTPVHSTVSARSTRLRQLSVTGRFGLVHALDDTGEALDWLDFVTSKRTRIALGSIDNAAISNAGGHVAWALREKDAVDQVQIHFARIDTEGVTSTQSALGDTRQ